MGHFYKAVVTILPLNTNSEFKERKKNGEKESNVIINNNNIRLELLRPRWVNLQTPSTKKEKRKLSEMYQ